MNEQPAMEQTAEPATPEQHREVQPNQTAKRVATPEAPDYVGQFTKLGAGGFVFESSAELFSVCQRLARSRFIPQAYQDKPDDVLACAMFGQTFGLDIMTSLYNVKVVKGTPGLGVDMMLALCRGSGLFDEDGFEVTWTPREPIVNADYTDDLTCHVQVHRKGKAKPIVQSWSVSDAKRAGLWGMKSKSGEPMPWTAYAKRMMYYRACGFALRDEFTDIVKGCRTKDELDVLREQFVVPGEDDAPQSGSAALLDKMRAMSAPAPPEEETAPPETPSPKPKRGRPKKTETPAEPVDPDQEGKELLRKTIDNYRKTLGDDAVRIAMNICGCVDIDSANLVMLNLIRDELERLSKPDQPGLRPNLTLT